MKRHGFLWSVFNGEAVPWWLGVIYDDCSRRRTVCTIVPLNWPVAVVLWVYMRLRFPARTFSTPPKPITPKGVRIVSPDLAGESFAPKLEEVRRRIEREVAAAVGIPEGMFRLPVTTNNANTSANSWRSSVEEIERAMSEIEHGIRNEDPITRMKRPVWICHPDSAPFHTLGIKVIDRGQSQGFGPFGMPIVTNSNVPRTIIKRELPSERFVEYGESDRAWLTFFGLMVERDTGRPAIFCLDSAWPGLDLRELLLSPGLAFR